jgi:hypothetical protein
MKPAPAKPTSPKSGGTWRGTDPLACLPHAVSA